MEYHPNLFISKEDADCPLSPLLFARAIESLAAALCTNSNISGFKVGEQEFKVSLHADDLALLEYVHTLSAEGAG